MKVYITLPESLLLNSEFISLRVDFILIKL
jgi:hypothetical protein